MPGASRILVGWSRDDLKTVMAGVLAADGARPTVEFDQVRQPQKWWRKDGTRPIVGESTVGLLWHDPSKQHELMAVRALREAIEAGDDSRLDELADAALAAEDDHSRRVAHAQALKAQADAKAAAEVDEIDALIEQGWNPTEAESSVTGESVCRRSRNSPGVAVT